jgi:hypothetical protein
MPPDEPSADAAVTTPVSRRDLPSAVPVQAATARSRTVRGAAAPFESLRDHVAMLFEDLRANGRVYPGPVVANRQGPMDTEAVRFAIGSRRQPATATEILKGKRAFSLDPGSAGPQDHRQGHHRRHTPMARGRRLAVPPGTESHGGRAREGALAAATIAGAALLSRGGRAPWH